VLLTAERDAVLGLLTGTKEAGRLLVGKRTTLMEALGKETLPPRKRDFIRHLHAAMKNPVLESEYYRSLLLRSDHAMRNGVNLRDPLEIMRIETEAWKDGKRAIFMQDNWVTDRFNQWLYSARARAAKQGYTDLEGFLARLGHAEMPIVRIPTNLVAEAFEHLIGLPRGLTTAGIWYAKGIENLKDQPVVADAIMRQLKKGTVGTALGLLGFALWKTSGGFYVHGMKRDNEDQEPGSIGKVGQAWLHAPQFQAFQYGVTLGKMVHRQIKKSSGETYGWDTAALAATIGLIDETPIFKEMGVMGKLGDPRTSSDTLAKQVLGKAIPGLVQWTAKKMDPANSGAWLTSEAVQRDPHGWVQTAESMIPGLRERVPTKEENAAASKAQEGYWRKAHPAARKK
jgi:hypothetical protein